VYNKYKYPRKGAYKMNESALNVRQLMEMYGTSKPTIHEKLKHADLSPYVRKQNNITLLDKEGLNIFNTLMAHSKVGYRKFDEKKDESCNKVSGNTGDIFNNPYVESLKKQIESFQQEKEFWSKERERYLTSIETITKNLSEFQKLLPAPASVEKSSSIWQKIKKSLNKS
jgi:hypothetical protein